MKHKNAAAEPKPDKYIVLVLGMHRSGTSTFTGIMHHLGCVLPDDLMPATEANPKGYFESVAVSRFNDRMLDTAGATWLDWHPINASWFASPVGQAFLPEVRDLLEVEFGSAPLAVLKDPRICRIVPFWMQGAAMAGYKALPVLIHRNPVEVAASLKKRDGIELVEGYMIWLRHVLDAEKATRQQPRFITSYNLILSDWSAQIARLQKDLDIVFPRSDHRAAAIIEDFVSPELRHFVEPEGKPLHSEAVPAWVRDTYAILERWATKGEAKADHKALDLIGEQVDAVTPAFAELVEAGKKRIKSLTATVAEHKSARDAKHESLEQALARIAEEELKSGTAQEQLQAQKGEAVRLEESLKAARHSISAHEAQMAEISAHEAQMAERKTQIERLRGDLGKVEASLAQRSQEFNQVEVRAQNAQAQIGDLKSEAARLEAALETARQSVSEHEARVGEREAELERLRGDMDDMETSLAKRGQDVAQVEARAQAAETHVSGLHAEMAELAGRLEGREAQIGDLKSEAARLEAALETARQSVSEHEARVGEREAELERLRGDLSQSESSLAQRKEEAEQAWQRAASAEALLEEKTAKLEKLAEQEQIQVRELALLAHLLTQSDAQLQAERASGRDAVQRLDAKMAELKQQSEEQLQAERTFGQKRAAQLEADLDKARDALSAVTTAETALRKMTTQQQVHLNELAQMAKLVNQSEQSLEAVQAESQTLRAQMAAQTTEATNLRTETQRLRDETAAQQAHIKYVEGEFVAIRNSRFWKATGPVRRMLDAMRGKT